MTTTDGNVLVNKDNILQELDTAGVLAIDFETPDEVWLTEACDHHFNACLDKQELKAFIDALTEIHDLMK